MTTTYKKALRTFASKPFVVVERDTMSILGSSGNNAHARALGASAAGENGYRVVNLSDVEGFDAGASKMCALEAAALACGGEFRKLEN